MKSNNDIELFRGQLQKELGDNLLAFMIYGSFISESQDEFSDTDLCIVLNKKDENSAKRIRQAVSMMRNRNYFVVALERNEFEENIKSGDIFYKYEIIHKGQIVYEKDKYISVIRKYLGSMKTDFELAERINIKRYQTDKKGVACYLEDALERIKWAFSDLVYLRFAKTHVEPTDIGKVSNLMKQDKILLNYVDDFMNIMKINKDYRHRRINFPFKEIGYFHERLQSLENDVGFI